MKILVIFIALVVTCRCKPVEKTKLKDRKTTRSANDHDGLKLVVDKKQHLSPTITPKSGEKEVYPGETAELFSSDSPDPSIPWKIFRIKREVDEKQNNAFYNLVDPPKLFSGTEEDIPQTVLNATPGTVVTYKGIQHIWRWKQTREDCFKACVYEPRILCEYYYQYTDAEKCILMVHDYRKLPVSKPPSMIQTPSTPQPQKWMRTEKPKKIQKRMNKIVSEITLNQNDETVSELIPTELVEKESEVILNEVPKQMSDKLEVTVSDTIPKTLDALVPETMPVPEVPKINKVSIVKKEDLNTLKQMVEKVEHQLAATFDSLNVGTETREKFMHSLLINQNNVKKTIKNLENQMALIKEINPHFLKAVTLMGNRHETLVGQIDNMDKYEHQIANSLASLGSKVNRIDGTLKTIQESNEKVSRQMSGEELANPEFNRNILELRRQVEDLKDKIQMNPTLVMLTKNQRVLSEALESLDRQLAVNGRRVSHLDESAKEWGGRLYQQEENQKTLSDATVTLSNAVKELRNDVLKLENPQSEINLKSTKEMRELRSDMEVMKKSYSKLQTEVSSARIDLTRLVKDLVNLQVSYHESKATIMGLVEANRNIKLDTHQMNSEQEQMITHIQTLSTVYRTVLSALHNLEFKQIQVMQQLERDSHDIKTMSNYGGIKDQNLLLVNIKNFQTKLIQKFLDLKLEVDKAKQSLHLKVDEHIPKKAKDHKDTNSAHTSKGPQTNEQGKKVHPARQLQLVQTLKVIQNNQELQDMKTKMKNIRKNLEDSSVNLSDPKTKDQPENALQNDAGTSSLLTDLSS